MSAELKSWVHSRGYIRGRITLAYSDLDTYSSLNETEKTVIRSKLNKYEIDLKKLDSDIQVANYEVSQNETELDNDIAKSDEYNDKLQKCLAHLAPLAPPALLSIDQHRSLLKSPTAPLPNFNGDVDEDYSKFIMSFEETIQKFSYPEFDKFLLLRQQLGGRALVLIETLETDNRSYASAKKLLDNAFASPSVVKHNIIRRISEMKLSYKDDPYIYISKINSLMDSVEKLKIDTECFLQHFFWGGLNEVFQSQLIQIVNKTRPSLNEIVENYFDAVERYNIVINKPKFKKLGLSENKNENSIKSTTNYAVKVENKVKQKCNLCSHDGSDFDHPTFKCLKYKSPADKLQKIKESKGCIKCSSLSHTTDACKFKLKRKCNCGKWHFSFICVDSKSNFNKSNVKSKNDLKTSANAVSNETSIGKIDSDEKTNIESEISCNTIVVTDALPNVQSDGTILPTFCFDLGSERLRALRDPGCQSNFITTEIADKLKLNVVNSNVTLNIIGFNGPQRYDTKIVSMEIMFDRIRTIEAVCVPEIKIKLELPGIIKIAKHFLSCGHELADKFLVNSEKVSDINFILGSKSAYCLKSTDVGFGLNETSIFCSTVVGTMLIGEVKTVMSNLPYLPSLSSGKSVEETVLPKLSALSSSDNFVSEGRPISSTQGQVSVSMAAFSDILSSDFLINDALADTSPELLEYECDRATFHDNVIYDDDESSELNKKLIKFVFDETSRDESGRLQMPLLWRTEVAHLLGVNFELSKSILNSNLKKLQNNPLHLELYDQVFKEQESLGVLERIENLPDFMEKYPNYSFMPHMGIFRLKRSSTKCRVVYLSNLCQKDPNRSLTVSHNQCMFSGPCLNQNISSALTHLRFDEKILIFDLCKAFNMISLSEHDSARLCCMWYRDISKQDYSLVYYKNSRLMFGLRCSPTILMLALYKLLIIDSENDEYELKFLKQIIYQLFYVDNGAITANSTDELLERSSYLNSIFNPYGFNLQQFVSNDCLVNAKFNVDEPELKVSTKLLGMIWNCERDTISTNPITLNLKACTKRQVLQSIASQYDIYNLNGPLLNRARLHIHKLQCEKDLGWDDKLCPETLNEWQNIVRQANSSPPIEVSRFVGKRSDEYKLFAFVDSSKKIYGAVIYLFNVFNNNFSFVTAKNRLINAQMSQKSIPTLELQSLVFGSQCVTEIFKDLSGAACTAPINITELNVYSDSMVALAWLNSFFIEFSKMQKRSVFVMNRLEQIKTICEIHPINYNFIPGIINPGDFITRTFSHRQLVKSNYITGPDPSILEETNRADNFKFQVPNSHLETQGMSVNTSILSVSLKPCHLVSPERISKFSRFLGIHVKIFSFISKLKLKVKTRRPEMFPDFVLKENLMAEASNHIIKVEQNLFFPEIYDFFDKKNVPLNEIPSLVTQLNVFKDSSGLLRVKCKLDRRVYSETKKFPLLVPKTSRLTELIIEDTHRRMKHAGCYSVLKEIRKNFWIPRCFSTVKGVLRRCVACRRFNRRTVKLNQSAYMSERIDPEQIPYNYIFLDYIGPFDVKINGNKVKKWLLCVTCMWSRSINLIICHDYSVKEFLRSFQLHSYQWGLPSVCITDMGSQIIAGTNIITAFLNDPDTNQFFDQSNIKKTTFKHFPKGHSELGAMVEICVKLVKRLIHASIGKNILSSQDFEFLIQETILIVNKRPISFKDGLRDSSGIPFPDAITPEILLHGYELPSLNVIPDLQQDPDLDPDWLHSSPNKIIHSNYEKLKKVRSKLKEIYHSEFLTNLISQSTDRKNRFKPVVHKILNPGDIVLLKETFTKPLNFPMGIVKEITKNSLGETTAVKVFKGKTRELVERHASTIIPLLTCTGYDDTDLSNDPEINDSDPKLRSKRSSAIAARQKIKTQINN